MLNNFQQGMIKICGSKVAYARLRAKGFDCYFDCDSEGVYFQVSLGNSAAKTIRLERIVSVGNNVFAIWQFKEAYHVGVLPGGFAPNAKGMDIPKFKSLQDATAFVNALPDKAYYNVATLAVWRMRKANGKHNYYRNKHFSHFDRDENRPVVKREKLYSEIVLKFLPKILDINTAMLLNYRTVKGLLVLRKDSVTGNFAK